MAFKMYGKAFSIVFQELFFSEKIKNSEALNFNIVFFKTTVFANRSFSVQN